MFLDILPGEICSIYITSSSTQETNSCFIHSASTATATVRGQDIFLMYTSPYGTCPLGGAELEFRRWFL